MAHYSDTRMLRHNKYHGPDISYAEANDQPEYDYDDQLYQRYPQDRRSARNVRHDRQRSRRGHRRNDMDSKFVPYYKSRDRSPHPRIIDISPSGNYRDDYYNDLQSPKHRDRGRSRLRRDMRYDDGDRYDDHRHRRRRDHPVATREHYRKQPPVYLGAVSSNHHKTHSSCYYYEHSPDRHNFNPHDSMSPNQSYQAPKTSVAHGVKCDICPERSVSVVEGKRVQYCSGCWLKVQKLRHKRERERERNKQHSVRW